MKELSQKMYFFSLVSFIKSLTYLGKAAGLVCVVFLSETTGCRWREKAKDSGRGYCQKGVEHSGGGWTPRRVELLDHSLPERGAGGCLSVGGPLRGAPAPYRLGDPRQLLSCTQVGLTHTQALDSTLLQGRSPPTRTLLELYWPLGPQFTEQP